jgi:hypothetical protein
LAAGVLGEAGDLTALVVREPETDDMHGDVDACRFQCGCDRAGVGLAGLDAVGDQDHRRLLFGIAQNFGGLADRVGDRRLPLRVEAIGRGGDGIA